MMLDKLDPADAVELPLTALAACVGQPKHLFAPLRRGLGAPERRPRGALMTRSSHGAARFLTSGWAALIQRDDPDNYCVLLVPGDPIDLALIGGPRTAIMALTAVQYLDLAPAQAGADAEGGQAVSAAFMAARRHAEQLLLDQIRRRGAAGAVSAMLDLLVELRRRLDVVGLVDACGFALPLSQQALASALGLTPTHINRTLKQLRMVGAVEMVGSRVRLLDERIAGMARVYNHLEREA